MTITSSMLFELLKKDFRITEIANGTDNLCVSIPKLLTLEETAEDVLYICEWSEVTPALIQSGHAYLIIADRVPLNLPPVKSSMGIISTNLTPIHLLYRVFSLFAELQAWDMALKDTAYSPHSLADVFEISQRLFPFPLALVDRLFNIVEYTPDLNLGFSAERNKEGVKIPSEMVNELLTEPGFGNLETLRGVFCYPLDPREGRRICLNIHHRGQYLGRLMANIEHGGTPGIRQLFDHLGSYVTTAFLKYTDDILVKRQNDRIHTLFKKMLNSDEEVSEKAIRGVFDAYGWDLSNSFLLHVIDLSGHSSQETVIPYLCTHLERDWPNSCAIANTNEIIWIVNTDLSRETREGQAFSLAFVYLIRELCCKAGISSPFRMDVSLAIYYKQAKIALKFGQQKRDYHWYYRFSEYLLDYAFALISSDMPSQEFCHPGIRRLAQEDEATGSELVKTLYYFLRCNFNTSQAADKMFVHRSTFIRQMKKIKDLTGIDWNDNVDLDTLLWTLASFRLTQIQYPM